MGFLNLKSVGKGAKRTYQQHAFYLVTIQPVEIFLPIILVANNSRYQSFHDR